MKHPQTQPRTLAIQIKSKTLNFNFRIPHNLLPTPRFSLHLKFQRFRLILKSVPTHTHSLKSKIFTKFINLFSNHKSKHHTSKRSKSQAPVLTEALELILRHGVRKGAVALILYVIKKLFFAYRSKFKVLFIIIISVICCWGLGKLCGGFCESWMWWFLRNATSSSRFKEILSDILAAIGHIDDPILQFF